MSIFMAMNVEKNIGLKSFSVRKSSLLCSLPPILFMIFYFVNTTVSSTFHFIKVLILRVLVYIPMTVK